MKLRLHWLQGKGFSPVCIRMWRFAKDLNFMILAHTGHFDWPFSRRIGSIICKNISNSKFISFSKKNYNTYFLTMFTTKMSFQRWFLITGIITLTASIRFFSSMNKDVTCNHLFCFHDSGTQRTFDLTTRKSNWLNNLQHFKKFQNIYFLL